MKYRQRLLALEAPIFALLLSGCGSYSDEPAGGSTTGGTTTAASSGGASSTATMTTTTDSTTGSSTTGGGTTGDSTSGDSTSGDSTTGDSTTGDSTSGGGTSGDSTTGDSTTGGPAPDASCDSPTAACGGDVVGAWTVASSCLEVSGELDMTLTGLGCTEPPMVTGTMEVSGTLTFGDDGSVTDETTTTGEWEFELGPGCLEISGTMTTCARITLQTLGFSSSTCEDNMETGGCNCTASVDQSGGPSFPSLDVSGSGSYVTADNTLTATYFTDVDYSYCVADNILTMTPETVNVTGTVAGEIVLQK